MRQQTGIRKLQGRPTAPGFYIQVFDLNREEGDDYANVLKVEQHPDGSFFTTAGRLDQIPGVWYGPLRTSDN